MVHEVIGNWDLKWHTYERTLMLYAIDRAHPESEELAFAATITEGQDLVPVRAMLRGRFLAATAVA